MSKMLRIGLFLALSFTACVNERVPFVVRDDASISGKPDLAFFFPDVDLAGTFTDDGGETGEPNICGDTDPGCQEIEYSPDEGTGFPLQSDAQKDPNEADNGVSRDPNGYLSLDSTSASFHFLWIANSGEGTASKINTKTIREVARYSTVTCYSLPGGSEAACDGVKGCCSADDYLRWTARKNKQQPGPHQAIQRSTNYPSRTAVDINGDLFISNRAFGGQPSVTHIANDVRDCKDRNKNGRIDTSSDVNGDGIIDVNDPKEYFGVKDECILWTTNSLQNNGTGRPLGLGQGSADSGLSDAWAGAFSGGNFVRIDGKSGEIKAETPPIGNSPYGLAVDSSGYAWAGPLGGGRLCYFDTRNPQNVGCARGQATGYGVTLDRDQNVWVGSRVGRYTPDRTGNGWDNLGKGFWTYINGAGGTGIAADSRTNKKYFVWSCGGGIKRIPASEIALPKGQDQTVNLNLPTIQMGCNGVGVDTDQNIWGATDVPSKATVDKEGNFVAPVQKPAANGAQCPQGDMCPINAGAYTYSDFTGFGLRNFTRPEGRYSMVIKGCVDTDGNATDTRWESISFDGVTPPNTLLTVHARTGNTEAPDQSWGNWTDDGAESPFRLGDGVLAPNMPDAGGNGYLQIEFLFKSTDRKSSPKLRSFGAGFRCERIG